MIERNENESLEQDSFETGSTCPPKSRAGIIAGILMAVILGIGMASTAGVFWVPLQHLLPDTTQDDSSLLFTPSDPAQTTGVGTVPEILLPEKSDTTVVLNTVPAAVENVPQAGGLSLQQIYEKTIDSVVSITCTLSSGTASGTGVVLSEDGYLVTNCHVVEDAQAISVLLTDGREFSAAVVGTDPVSDLAVLYIQARGLTAAEFGNSDSLRVGDLAVAIGDPLGVELRGTMTDGIISAINRDLELEGRTMTLIQTNAALNSGNSGGPLLNCYGQVVGINTLKIGTFVDSAGVEGLGFAIPSTTVKEVVDQLISQGYVTGRPGLGLMGQSVSSHYQQFYKLPAGVCIITVTPDGPAAQAGLTTGDIIAAVDGKRITGTDTLTQVLYGYQAGDTVTITYYRGLKSHTVQITLGQAGT